MFQKTLVAFFILGTSLVICNRASAQMPTNGTIDSYQPKVNGVNGTSYNAGDTLKVTAVSSFTNPAGNPERTIRLRVEVYDHNTNLVATSTALTTIGSGATDSLSLVVEYSAPNPLNGNNEYYFICDLYYLDMGNPVSLAADDEEFRHMEMP